MGRGQQKESVGKAAPRTPTIRSQAITDTLSEVEVTTLATYEANSQAWSGPRSSDPQFWAKELKAFQELLPQGRILDVGSGNGRDALLLTGEGYEVTGI